MKWVGTDALPERQTEEGVTITGVQIPFGDLVILLIQVAFAAIPAAIVLALVVYVVGMAIGGF